MTIHFAGERKYMSIISKCLLDNNLLHLVVWHRLTELSWPNIFQHHFIYVPFHKVNHPACQVWLGSTIIYWLGCWAVNPEVSVQIRTRSEGVWFLLHLNFLMSSTIVWVCWMYASGGNIDGVRLDSIGR